MRESFEAKKEKLSGYIRIIVIDIHFPNTMNFISLYIGDTSTRKKRLSGSIQQKNVERGGVRKNNEKLLFSISKNSGIHTGFIKH